MILQNDSATQPHIVPYVVGINPNSPSNPHSALATGASPQDIANINTVPEHEAYVLYGGIVGGPDKNDRFWDLRGDWVQSEVGLDYVAPVVTIAARSVVNGTGDPFYTRLQAGAYAAVKPSGHPCDAAFRCGGGGRGLSEGGLIAMAVILGVAGCCVLGLATYMLVLARRRRAGGYGSAVGHATSKEASAQS